MAKRVLRQQPEEVGPTEEQLREQEDAKLARLEALGLTLAKTKKEAIEGRAASGIEDVWREDEEHYEGIDDANRGKVAGALTSKPPGAVSSAASAEQSTLFVNITAPYVEAAAAKVGDIIMSTDERSWNLKETPVPELIDAAKGGTAPGGLPIEVIKGLAQMNAPEEKAVAVAKAEQQSAQQKIDAAKQQAEEMIADAKEKAKLAGKRIEDWLVESQWHAEVREVIDDAAKIGTGVLKGPIPEKKKQQAFKKGELVVDSVTKPVSKRIAAENCYPDPSCGRSIHKGRYHWEKDHLTERQLMALRDDPTYIKSQIDRCIEEGPKGKSEDRKTVEGRVLDDKALYEVWYFYGYVTRENLEAAGCECKGDGPVQVPAIFTMVNDRVIKGALNPLDTGAFPYDYIPWKRRKNSPWGIGVGRQVRAAQQIVNASTRVMLTNAGRAAGPMLVLRNNVRGANGKNDITAWGVYYVGTSDSSNDDASKAAQLIQIPALTKELMQIIQFGLKLAEDTTGLPMLLQGQTGSAPETYGGQQLADRNATGLLRRFARLFDDCITEPHIRRYYTYLLMHGEDEEKGEFVIDARGSTALVEREITRQEIATMLEAALNPAFGLDPKKVMAQKIRADNQDPKDFQYSEEDQKKIDQAEAQGPPPDPRAEASLKVAQIRGDADVKKATLVQSADMAELQFKAQEAEKQRRHDMAMQDRAERMKIMELSQASQMSIADIKAQLAGKVITIKAQERMAAHKNATAPQVATPVVEPPGRAPAGQAFQR